MRVRYHGGAPYYACDAEHRRYGAPICNRASARRVDALVEELFLSVVNPQTVELSGQFDQKLRQEAALVDCGWQEKLQRLDYQADLARRRYEQVDPANRLVALTLETDWNQCLIELTQARQTHEAQRPTASALTSTLAEMQQVIAQLPEYWYRETVTAQDPKKLLRCLVEQVFLESQGKLIRTQVRWYGGAASELDVPKYLFRSLELYHRVRELARTYTDPEIAEQLNQAGLKTVKGKPWSPRRVMDFRRSNAIPSGFTTTTAVLRASASGYITSAEAAEQLGVSQSCIQRWYRLGILPGKHGGGQSPLWVH